jgi:hypothetical protein
MKQHTGQVVRAKFNVAIYCAAALQTLAAHTILIYSSLSFSTFFLMLESEEWSVATMAKTHGVENDSRCLRPEHDAFLVQLLQRYNCYAMIGT